MDKRCRKAKKYRSNGEVLLGPVVVSNRAPFGASKMPPSLRRVKPSEMNALFDTRALMVNLT